MIFAIVGSIWNQLIIQLTDPLNENFYRNLGPLGTNLEFSLNQNNVKIFLMMFLKNHFLLMIKFMDPVFNFTPYFGTLKMEYIFINKFM